MPTIEQISKQLAAQEPFPNRHPEPGDAAVAIILAGDESNLKICLIKRADRMGDPWSGHIALPGGRISEFDGNAQSAAEREVSEEVGLRINAECLIGRLPDLPIRRHGAFTGLTLSIFVYYAGPEPLAFSLNHEVAQAFWIDFDYLQSEDNRTQLTAAYEGSELTFPAIRIGENLLWGLTLRALELFGELIGAPLG